MRTFLFLSHSSYLVLHLSGLVVKERDMQSIEGRLTKVGTGIPVLTPFRPKQSFEGLVGVVGVVGVLEPFCRFGSGSFLFSAIPLDKLNNRVNL
jgi:hypothetical protein